MSDDYQQIVFWSCWNYIWVASCILPPIVILLGYRSTRLIRWTSMLIAFGLSWGLLFFSVWRKWGLRMSAAVSDEELMHASGDGANLIFSLILYGPVSSAIYVMLIMLLFQYLNGIHQEKSLTDQPETAMG